VFCSGKCSSAQQGYPVHELELLAFVEKLKRFREALRCTKPTARTNHHALVHFPNQKALSARQHRRLNVPSLSTYPVKKPGFASTFSGISLSGFSLSTRTRGSRWMPVDL